MKRRAARARSDRPEEFGVHLDVPGKALIAQANARIAWHREMAKAMTAELKSSSLKSDPERPPDWSQRAREGDLERKISSHLEYARFLTFVRESLVRNRRYRLALSDLTMLEISPKSRYY